VNGVLEAAEASPRQIGTFGGPSLPQHVRGLSIDLANTLYPLGLPQIATMIASVHDLLVRRTGKTISRTALVDLYIEIRDRQFAQNSATLCENDFPARLFEMIDRSGIQPTVELVHAASDAYAAGFVCAMRLPDHILETVAALSVRYAGRVVVCSNFILAEPIREILVRDGLMPHLRGAVVSCEVGFVKPHASVFTAVSELLELPPSAIAHIGDDSTADVGGARSAGMTSVLVTELSAFAARELKGCGADVVVQRLRQI
jgi:FMN phosphatase YigB (HAD superfamily)